MESYMTALPNKHDLHKISVMSVMLLVMPFNTFAFAEQIALRDWHQIGSGTFTYLGLSLYTATYYEHQLPQSNRGRALRIVYHRTIRKKQLLKATEKLWQRMRLLSEAQRIDYVNQLERFWPTVKKGDELLFLVGEDSVGEFLFNGKLIGTLTDASFAEAFLAIWLSADSPNQELRERLLGLTNS